MKYTKKYLTSNKVSINLPIQKEYDKGMKKLEKWGVVWSFSGEKPTKQSHWNIHKEDTCVDLHNVGGVLTYGSKKYYKQKDGGYKIITAKSFLNDRPLKVGDPVRILKEEIEKADNWNDFYKEIFKDMTGEITERCNNIIGFHYRIRNEKGTYISISPKYLIRIEEEDDLSGTILEGCDKAMKDFNVAIDKFVKAVREGK